jgi:hypothetical protein
LLVCFLAVGGFAIYQHTQINDLRRDLGSSQQDVTALRTGVVNTDNDIRKEVADLRDEISAGEQASSKALTQAQIMAKRRADAVAAKLEKEAAENSAVINDQISKVKESTDENANKIEGVTNDVSSVKGDVATAKSTIDQHSADLQSVRGDMGVMSGLVATNQKQIDYLKKLGDRNIYEFTISKKDGLAKVGDIRMQLARVNAKHNRYTVEVNADDKTIE